MVIWSVHRVKDGGNHKCIFGNSVLSSIIDAGNIIIYFHIELYMPNQVSTAD